MSESLWAQVIGHEVALRRLAHEADAGHTAQVYLFCGPAGIGKVLVARGLAQRLNCTGEQPPCGTCAGCRAVAHEVPSHIQVLRPAEQGGAGSGRSALHRIDDIRRLLAETSLRAVGGATPVYIIKSAEAMREEAANALLKTLEEPPARTVLVLTSEHPTALLPTVLSRVRRLDLGPVPTADIARWLRERQGVPAEAAALWAATCAGRPARALRLATDEAAQSGRTATLELVRGVGLPDEPSALWAAQKLLGSDEEPGGERLELALDVLEWWYRDAYLLSAGAGVDAVVNVDQQAVLAEFAGRWAPAQLRRCLAALHSARVSWQRNANAALVLEVLWQRLARGGEPAGLGPVC